MRIAAAAATLLTASALSTGVQQAQRTPRREVPLVFGLLRYDGILTPIVAHEKGQWVGAWPESTTGMPTVTRESEQPYWLSRGLGVPAQWYLPNAGSRTEAHVLTRVVHEEYCGYQIGLLTDAQRTTDDGFQRRLATTHPIDAKLPRDITATASRTGWESLIGRIDEAVLQEEAVVAADWEKHARRSAQLPPADQRQPLKVRQLYAYERDGMRVLYYKTLREYRQPTIDLPSVFVGTGWLREGVASGPDRLAAISYLTDPDITAGSIQPLGIVTIDKAIYWIVRDLGYEGESVSVIETSPRLRRVFKQYIGSC